MLGSRKPIKKVSSLLLLFASFLACIGCEKPGNFYPEPYTEEMSALPEELFPDYIYDEEGAPLHSSTRAAVAEDGYYFIANRILYFYNINDNVLFPLCTKTSCQHDSKSCEAFIFDFEEEDPEWRTNCLLFRVISYQGDLYMFSQKKDTGVILYRYNRTFSQQVKIAQLTYGSATPRSLCQDVRSVLFHEGYLYYLTFIDAQEGKQGKLEHDCEYTVHRIRLEEKAAEEPLFTFHYKRDPFGMHDIQLVAEGEDIYCLIASQINYLEIEDPVKQYVYRYREKDGVQLLWSYEGEENVNLFGAIGEGPVAACYSSCTGRNGDYFFLTEMEDTRGECTTVSCINLLTEESRTLYHTPYRWINQLRTDGENCYFIEYGEGKAFLTAIDSKGKLLRRYEIPYTDKMQEAIKEQGISSNEIPVGDLRLLLADQRYLAISSMNSPDYYRDLSTITYMPAINGVMDCTNGIGLIKTEDFLSGKEIEVIRLFE